MPESGTLWNFEDPFPEGLWHLGSRPMTSQKAERKAGRWSLGAGEKGFPNTPTRTMKSSIAIKRCNFPPEGQTKWSLVLSILPRKKHLNPHEAIMELTAKNNQGHILLHLRRSLLPNCSSRRCSSSGFTIRCPAQESWWPTFLMTGLMFWINQKNVFF